MSVQVPNGVVDIAVADEAEAVAVAKRYLSYFQGAAGRVGLRRPAPAAQRHPREPAARLRRPRGDRPPWPTPARCSSCGATSASAWSPSLVRIEGRPVGRHRQQPDAPRRAPSTATAPTRRPASCSSATPSTSRCCSCATRPGSWSAPRSRRPPWSATAAGMFVIGGQPDRAVLHDRAAQGLRPRRPGHGRRQLQGAVLHGGVADRRVRRHGPRGRGEARLPQRAGRARATPTSARASTTRWSPACTSTARRVNTATTFEIDDVIDPAESRRWITSLLVSRPSGSWRDRPRKRPHLDTW